MTAIVRMGGGGDFAALNGIESLDHGPPAVNWNYGSKSLHSFWATLYTIDNSLRYWSWWEVFLVGSEFLWGVILIGSNPGGQCGGWRVIWWGVVLGVKWVLVGNSRAERCFPVGNDANSESLIGKMFFLLSALKTCKSECDNTNFILLMPPAIHCFYTFTENIKSYFAI